MTALSTAGLLRPSIRLLGRSVSSFLAIGALGFVVGIGLPAAIAPSVGQSSGVILGLGGVAILTFLGLAMWTKIRTGDESLTFYHHAIAVMVAVVAALVIGRQPLLPYLDLAMIGLAAFLVLGRIGCLTVGCCHGRPAGWGIRYSEEHRVEGLAWYLVDVSLVPVQAFEAVWTLVVVLGGGLVVLAAAAAPGAAHGAVLGWTIAAYAVGRFGLEFLRGDAERRWRLGFTEAQWTSLALAVGVAVAGAVGLLPFGAWQPVAVITVAAAIAFVALLRRGSRLHLLLRADHIHQVAEMVEAAHRSAIARPDAPPAIGFTGLGVRVSASHVDTDLGLAHVYGISGEGDGLAHIEAAAIGDLIVRLRHRGASSRLLEGHDGVHHMLVLET
jgi:Prolipoprotein diacylglyceryl transferase